MDVEFAIFCRGQFQPDIVGTMRDDGLSKSLVQIEVANDLAKPTALNVEIVAAKCDDVRSRPSRKVVRPKAKTSSIDGRTNSSRWVRSDGKRS